MTNIHASHQNISRTNLVDAPLLCLDGARLCCSRLDPAQAFFTAPAFMRLPTQVLVSAAHAPHPPTSELKGYEVKEHENSAHLLEHHFNVVALLDGDMTLLHALVTLDIMRAWCLGGALLS